MKAVAFGVMGTWSAPNNKALVLWLAIIASAVAVMASDDACNMYQGMLESSIDKVHACNSVLANLAPTLPKIATMTIACRCSPQQRLDLAALAEIVRASETRFVLGTKPFKNSLMLSLPKGCDVVQGRSYGIKVFANGAIHVTGISEFCQMALVTRHILDLIGRAGGGNSTKLTSPVVQLINCNFRLQTKLCLQAVNTVLSTGQPKVFTRGLSAHYPALIVKMPTDGATASIHLFASGSVLISGINSPDQIAEAYEAVVPVLDAAYAIISASDHMQAYGK